MSTELTLVPSLDATTDLRAQRKALAGAAHVHTVCNAMPWPVLIVNDRRQLVLANPAALALMDVDSIDTVLGGLPGDVLQCRNRHDGPQGCGSSRHCHGCGLFESLAQAKRGSKASLECVVVTERAPVPIECQAVADRIEVDGVTYTLLALSDQRAENRRRTLERLFFHDVLNTAGNLTAVSNLLPSTEGTEAVELQAMLQDQSRRLVEEIRAQRDLSAAESGELHVDLRAVSMVRLIAEIVDAYQHHPLAAERELVVLPGPAVRAAADPVLLGRALGNLVKNALEASPARGRVTVAHGVVDDRIELRVQNHGEVPDEVRHHLFRRVVSTKGSGRGLGTYSVRLLVEDYLGGQVGFRSTPEDGTVFWIRLGAPLNTSLVR